MQANWQLHIQRRAFQWEPTRRSIVRTALCIGSFLALPCSAPTPPYWTPRRRFIMPRVITCSWKDCVKIKIRVLVEDCKPADTVAYKYGFVLPSFHPVPCISPSPGDEEGDCAALLGTPQHTTMENQLHQGVALVLDNFLPSCLFSCRMLKKPQWIHNGQKAKRYYQMLVLYK